jgi:hypothetical protein
MKQMKTMKNLLRGAVLAPLLLTAPIHAQTPDVQKKSNTEVRVNLGYNDMQYGAIAHPQTQGTGRVRALTNVDIDFGPINTSYRGMSEVNISSEGLLADSYFGVHRLGLGLTEHKDLIQPTVRLLAGSDGVFDTKYGIESKKLASLIADYGWVGAYTNGESHNVQALLGYSLAPIAKATGLSVFDNMTADFVHSTDFGVGKPSHYGELQLNKPIGKKGYIFGRLETPGYDWSNRRVLVGAGFKW